MAGASAFMGDPKRKAQVLAAASVPSTPDDVWWPVNGNQAAINAFCDANGLDLAFFYFLRALVGPSGPEMSQPLLDALTALEPGVDTRAVFDSWMLWIWEGRDSRSLKAALAGTDALAPAVEIVQLHLAQQGEDAVTRQHWRQARNAITKLEGLSGESLSAARVVAAMGWDFMTTPGAAADLVHTIFGEESERIGQDFGWTEVDSDSFQKAIIRLHGLAHAELGAPPEDRADREAMEAFYENFQALVAREETEDEARTSARMKALGDLRSEKIGALQRQLREGLARQMNAYA